MEDVKNWLTFQRFKEEAALFSIKLKLAAVFKLTKLQYLSLLSCISNFAIFLNCILLRINKYIN